MECHVLQGGIQVLYGLIHHNTCRLEARQALIYQLASGLTGENGNPISVTGYIETGSGIFGHEDISTTGNIYAHLMDRDRKATSDIMDGVLRNSLFCSEKCSDAVGA